MPADLWTDAVRMAGCGLTVAAVALPVTLLAWLFARRRGEPLLPTPRRWRGPWAGAELLVVFPLTSVAPLVLVDPILTASGFFPAVYGPDAADAWAPVRPLWAAVFFVPVWITGLVVLRRALYPGFESPRTPVASLPARVAVGGAGWVVIHPPVLLAHLAVSGVFLALGWPLDEHPLAKLFRDGRPVLDQALLFAQACVFTPLLEEFLFRGMLLPWLLAGRERTPLTLGIAAVVAVALGAQRTGADGGLALMAGPVLFAVLMAAGWGGVRRVFRSKRRTAGAVYASAALFAAVHSAVWPSPVPLFVLGLGLGWLAVRTRGILAPVIVHGLFNAVSVLFVLRGG